MLALWVATPGAIGLAIGIALLMGSLRWLLPWEQLHALRQQARGWRWLLLQWIWVLLWGVCLPLICLTTGALGGGAFAARNLIQRENLGELVLTPICQRLAQDLQNSHKDWGDLTSTSLSPAQFKTLIREITPESIKKLDDRRFARFALERLTRNFFAHQASIADDLCQRLPPSVKLPEVVRCASQVHLSPALARLTFYWILLQAMANLPLLALLWLGPWALFQLYWRWRQRRPY